MLVRVVLLAFAAAATPAFAQPKTTLNFGMAAQDIGQLDPHFAVSTIDRVPAALMFNGLVRFAPGSTDPATLEPDLAEKLAAVSPGELSKVLLTTGGSDANEVAIKLARTATGRFNSCTLSTDDPASPSTNCRTSKATWARSLFVSAMRPTGNCNWTSMAS